MPDEEIQTKNEGFTSAERQKYALLAALVVIGLGAMLSGFDPIAILTGLGGLFAGVMIDPHAE